MAVALLKYAAGKPTAVVAASDDIAVRGVEVADGYGLASQSGGGTIDVGTDANTDAVDVGRSGYLTTVKGSLTVDENLVVTGTTFSTSSEVVLIGDNYVDLNFGYETAVAETGGFTVNYLPTATVDTANGAVVAGIAATSNPTMVTDGSATFSAGDIIQIANAEDTENNGLYEVMSHVLTTLEVRGIGTEAAVEKFSKNQFVANADDQSATITKVTVSVMRCGTDGVWETGSGSASGITYSDLATAAGATLDSAYQAGNSITTTAADGNILFTLADDAGDFQVVKGANDYILADHSSGILNLGTSGAITVEALGATTVKAGLTINTAGTLDCDRSADFSANLVNSAGEFLVSGGNAQLNDNIVLSFGSGDDFTVACDGTDTLFDNTHVTGSTLFRCGTDTSATDFQVQNDSGSPLFTVNGAGQVDIGGNLDVTGGIDIDADNVNFTIGAGADITLVHDGSDSTLTSTTGDFMLDNTNVTGTTIMALGTDTAATSFVVENDSGTGLFTVTGAGLVTVAASGVLAVTDVGGLTIAGRAINATGANVSGATRVGTENGVWSNISPASDDVEAVLEALDLALGGVADKVYQLDGVTIETTAATLRLGAVVVCSYDTDHPEVAAATTTTGISLLGVASAEVAGDTALAAGTGIITQRGAEVALDTANIRNEAWTQAADINKPIYLLSDGKLSYTAPATGTYIWRVGFITGDNTYIFDPQLIATDVS